METILERLLARINFLNVNTPQLLAEFASHIGWSLGYLFVVYCFMGDSFLLWGAYLWVFYSVYKELIEDGHLKRLINGVETRDDFKDLVTDFLSRVIGPIIFILCRHLK